MRGRPGVALIALLLLAAGVRLRWFTGLVVGDDVVYSAIAADRLSGTVHFFNVHQCRPGFLLPLLGSTALLGPGEFSLVLYNLLCSLGLVAALVVLADRCFGAPSGILAGALAALHPNLSRFATECHTDTPVALWLSLAVLALHAATTSARPRPLLALAGLLVGWAYLHKEHAVFLLPFVAVLPRALGFRWTWLLPFALPFAGVVAAETASYAVLTDNPFKRWEMIRYWHANQYMAEQYPDLASLLYRLFLDLPLRLLAPWNGLAFPLAAIAAGSLLRDRVPGARWIAGWFAAIFLGYSFWPSGLFPFRPGFSLYDWTLPVLQPPLIVLLAGGLARLRPKGAVACLLLLSGLHLVAIDLAWRRDRRFAEGAREARAIIRAERPARVVAADKTIESLTFFEGHDPERVYVRFQDPEPTSRCLVVVEKLWTEPGVRQRPLRPEVLAPPGDWILLYESPRVVVYRVR